MKKLLFIAILAVLVSCTSTTVDNATQVVDTTQTVDTTEVVDTTVVK